MPVCVPVPGRIVMIFVCTYVPDLESMRRLDRTESFVGWYVYVGIIIRILFLKGAGERTNNTPV